MIEVIERKEVPTNDITCGNCYSKLRYGNADLQKDYDEQYTSMPIYGTQYCFNCPVCGCKVKANWIVK